MSSALELFNMRLNKLLGVLGAGFLFTVLSRGEILANEGTVVLNPEAGYVGKCYLASVYIDSSYRVIGSCRGLPVALSAEQNKYVLWRQMGESAYRMVPIENGKFNTAVAEKFENVFITVESDSYTNKPSGPVVARGTLSPLPLNVSGQASGGTFSSSPGVAQGGVTVSLSPRSASNSSVSSSANTTGADRLGVLLRGVGRALIYGFVLLLIIVGVLSFLSRRKNL